MTKNNIDKKGIAQSLFLDGAYTQEEIAAKVGTTRQTVSRWVRDGAWEELKASRTITTEQLIAQYKRQLAEINKRIEANASRQPRRPMPSSKLLEPSKSWNRTSVSPIASLLPCGSSHGCAPSMLKRHARSTTISMRSSRIRQGGPVSNGYS